MDEIGVYHPESPEDTMRRVVREEVRKAIAEAITQFLETPIGQVPVFYSTTLPPGAWQYENAAGKEVR